MSGYKGHILAGVLFVAIFLILNYYFNWFTLPSDPILWVMMGFITIFYSILPDVDIQSSKAREIVFILGIIGMLLCLFYNYILYGIIIGTALLFTFLLSHRGIMHSVLMAIIFSALLWFVNPILIPIGFLAYISHLIVDREVKLK
jgi:membrane-bound metal-dependent hydrolase YbcI (DUF457 family)